MEPEQQYPQWLNAFATFMWWVVGVVVVYALATFIQMNPFATEWTRLDRFLLVIAEGIWTYFLLEAAEANNGDFDDGL